MVKKFFLMAFITVLAAGSAFAAHPLITDDTGTQGKGKFQLEVTAEYAHEDEDGTKENSAELATTLSYGAADTVDIVLGVPYQWIRVKEDGSPVLNENGLSDVSIEVKWRFFEQEKFSLALKPGLSLPTGDDKKGLGSGKVNFSAFLIATWDAAPLSVHANLGYLRNENDVAERKNLWHASVGAGYAATEKLTLVGNIGIEQNTDRNVNTHPAFLLGGFIYSISNNFDIDFGLKAALNEPEADYAVLAGIAWRF
jgi:hypothetical protein